jgi:Fe-S-cluster containining protein
MTFGYLRIQAQLGDALQPTRPRDLLPILRSFADHTIAVAVEQSRRHGRPVTCQKGCSACCHQLVGLSGMEAHRLRDLVEVMPESRRTQVQERFRTAQRRLHEAGLLQKLKTHVQWTGPDHEAFVWDYFCLQLPCPFLEDDCCSIYDERPLVCREYVVSSPAANCSRPTESEVRRIPLPVWVSRAAIRYRGAIPDPKRFEFVPLPLALEWAETHPDDTPPAPLLEAIKPLLEWLGKVEDDTGLTPQIP